MTMREALDDLAASLAETTHAKALRLRPKCRRINLDVDNVGYYCGNCGMDLIETSSKWFRHGTEWRHPELGR